MLLTKEDILYMDRKKALRERKYFIEDIIIRCLESDNFKLGKDIVNVVLEFFPDEPPRSILRMIYRIMHINTDYLPINYEEDTVLL